MRDTIYRDEAIEAVCDKCDDNKAEHYPNCKEIQNCAEVKALSELPSAENSNAKTQNSNQETQNSNGDLIYRADAIEAVCGVVINEFDVSPTCGYEVAEKALSALPSAEAEEHRIYKDGYNTGKAHASADAVQVVRCKDCVYFHNGDCYNGNFPIKGDLANVYFDMKETDFCSYGERKGGDSE